MQNVHGLIGNINKGRLEQLEERIGICKYKYKEIFFLIYIQYRTDNNNLNVTVTPMENYRKILIKFFYFLDYQVNLHKNKHI